MSLDLFEIGMTVRLDRAIDRREPCCSNIARLHPGKAQHAAELRCAECGAPSRLAAGAKPWTFSLKMISAIRRARRASDFARPLNRRLQNVRRPQSRRSV